MRKVILSVLLALSVLPQATADVKIPQLPLGSASSSGVNDPFPYVELSSGITKRMKLSDLINLPTMQAQFTSMIPDQTGNNGKCLGTDGSATSWVTCGGGGGSGTVTSVAMTVPSWLQVSGSPITSSGTLAVTGSSQSANLVLASPNGSSGAVSPRALVGADLPNPSSSTKGGVQSYAAVTHQWITTISTSGVPSSSQPSFSDISGTLGVAAGGTGATSFTSGAPLIGNGTSAVSSGSVSGNTSTFGTTSGTLTNGNCVEIDASGNLIDAGAPCGSGGGSGVTTVGTFDSQSAAANGAVISSTDIYFQSADATHPGMVNASTQTIAGVKTFSSAPNLSSLTASLPLKLDGSKNITAAAIALGGSEVSGNLGVSHLNSGTSASSSTFWRGDGSWTAPSFSNLSGTIAISQFVTISGSAGSPNSVVAATGITTTASTPVLDVYVQGSGGPVIVIASPPIAVGADGQIVHVLCESDTNTITWNNSPNFIVNGSWTCGANDVLTLRSDGTNLVEVSRSR